MDKISMMKNELWSLNQDIRQQIYEKYKTSICNDLHFNLLYTLSLYFKFFVF